jgi:hypothetical protein
VGLVGNEMSSLAGYLASASDAFTKWGWGSIYLQRKGYVEQVFQLWLEQLASVTTQLIQLVSLGAGRELANLLLLDILETEIYPGGI